MSPKTVEHMTWHQSYDVVDGVMVHPSDGKIWKHFNSVHPYFVTESRNVRHRLYTDKFNPFESFVAPYSCWYVILTIYNLKFMFLFTVILNPNSLGWNMDVCLQPLIDELTELLSSKALTYDVLTKQNFFIGYILTNSIHLSHLLLLILVGLLYSRFTTWSSCFYLWSYSVLIIWAGIWMFVFNHWLMSWRSCGPLGLWLMMYWRNKIFL
jgi:hypothetical protein